MSNTPHDCMTYSTTGELLSHTTMRLPRGARYVLLGGRLCEIEPYELGDCPRVFVVECDPVRAGKVRITRSMTTPDREKRALQAWRNANY